MSAVPQNPFELLADWLPGTPGEDGWFPEMVLATMDPNGFPDARTVLLSRFEDGALYFHTDRRSQKVVQLETMPRAAVCLTFPESRRQVVAQGTVAAAEPEEEIDSYRRRSPYLRRLAWVNTPAVAALEPELRAAEWELFGESNPDESLRAPATWCGFALLPARLSFWQGTPDAPSHRVEYRAIIDGWEVRDLPG